MNKLSKQKRDQLILVAMGTFVIIFAVWYLLISAQKEKIAGAKKKAETRLDQVTKAENTVKRGDQIETELEEARQKLKAIEDTMASGDIYTWTVRMINGSLGVYGVEISDSSRPAEEKVSLFPSFPYKAAVFTVRGNAYYHDFGKFLADFENNLSYIRVQKLKMAPTTSANTNEPEKLSFEMEISALIRPTATQ